MTRAPKARADGEGSAYEEVPGRWRAALVIDGKTVRRRAKTEKEAKRKFKELERLRDARLNMGEGKQTIEAWITHWLTVLLPGKQAKPKTIQGHTYICAHYITPYLGTHQLVKLTAQHIDEWQAILRAKGLSEGTVANARRRLSAALEAARKRKLVPENVVKLTDAPTSAARPQTVLDEPQIVKLLDSLADHRLYAFYALAIATGMRQAELFGLRWPAVNLEAGVIIVREQLQRIKGQDGKRQIHREKSTKGGKDRTIPISSEVVALLRAHRVRQMQERLILGDRYHGGDLVFTSEDGTPLEGGAVLRQFKRALVRAELPEVTFHSLRHSAGSIMLAHGAQLEAVSDILGHSSSAITSGIYAHSFDDERRDAANVASSALFRRAK
ncbi:MAG: tyrosine-type recombinase/integrase [Chloroflexales bacterium]